MGSKNTKVMESNAVQENAKVLSEVNVAEHSSKDGNKQNYQPNTKAQKTENWIETPYKKLSKSCERLPPLIRKNSCDGLFLSHSMPSKTLVGHMHSAENKSNKTFHTIDIMKIKERNLKPDVTKDAGICADPNIPEMINNAGLPSLSSQTTPFESSRVGFFPRGSSEFARESLGQKPGFFHLSIEKPDTRRVTDHTHPLISSSKAEILTHEGGNTDLPRSCQAGSNVSRSLNSQCGYLRSTSSLAFSYHSSSGSSSSSSLSQSSPRESYLSRSLNSGQHREKQPRKNTQNLKNCLSQEDIPKICPSQPHWEKHRLSQLSSQTSQLSCDENIKGNTGSENVKGNCRASLKNLQSAPLEVCQEIAHSKKKDSNIHLDKESPSEILVSDKETSSAENTKISEKEKQESLTKKDLCVRPEHAEILSRTIRNVNSQNRTNSPYSAKVITVQQKMYRSMTVAKIETLSSRNESQRQILLGQLKRSNYQKSVSGLRPKDVGVCISSATMHKRTERNAAKQVQNKGCIFESKTVENKKTLASEFPKQHKVRKAPNGENKPLLDILAQRTQTASVTKLDSCVKIEDMFENLRDQKKEPQPNHKAVNRQKSAVEPKRVQLNVSCPKLLAGKPHQLSENQGSKRASKHSNQKKSNENESRSHKTSRKRQSKSKRKNAQQLQARSESEEDLHVKLGSNMALISGADWHIVTDCMDVSDVKVVDDSDVYQDYNTYVKGQQSDKDDNPDDNSQNENNKTIENFHSDFLNNLINAKEEEDKDLSHLTVHNVHSQNGNYSNQKLPSVDESPETLKTNEIFKNNNWNDRMDCSFDGKNTEQLNVLPEDLSFPDSEHGYADFNKDFSQSENIPENLNSSIADIDSKYETDFECLSGYDSDCPEEIENLTNGISDISRDCAQIDTAEVTQENLDSIVEELLNYSTSPICLEKCLSNVSLSETDSILFRSLKLQKESPFHAQCKSEDTAITEAGSRADLTENLEKSVTEKSFNKSLKSQLPHKFSSVDRHLSDKETGSLSQLEELNTKREILGRRDSTSTTSSFLSIEEDFSWKKGDLLGSGSYGRVWRGLTSEGEQIAVKQIVLDVTDREKAERKYQKVQEEVEILKTLQHKNIVSFLGMRREGEEVSIFMQYVTGGSIAQLLARFGPLDEPVFCSYTQQILEGVKYLHDKNVIHRDIKGGNVMLMPNSTIKLVDFGCAKRLCYSFNKNSLCNPTSLQGTPYWMAPEVIQETGHGKKSDIWSIGCTVFEMATKNPPWSNMNPYAAILAICSSKPVPTLPLEFSQKARDFVRVCLLRDPLKRPTASELLQDKFITTPHHGRRRKSVTCFN